MERLATERVRFNGLDPADRAAIAARWRRANDRLARMAWGATWDEVVAEEPATPVNEIVAPDPATAAAIEGLAAAAIGSL